MSERKTPTTIIQEISEFLNLSPPENLISEICQECRLDRMRDKKAQFDLDSSGNAIMYRKGLVGDWKNYFDDELNAYFDDVYHKKMATIDTTFKWRFSLED